MYAWLGTLVARRWPLFLAAWLLVLTLARLAVPGGLTAVRERDFTVLPPDAPSRRGDQVFRSAFPDRYAPSRLVIILWREQADHALSPADRTFITEQLVRRLQKIKPGVESSEPGGRVESSEPGGTAAQPGGPAPLVQSIRTANDPAIGLLLTSSDQHATLVLLECSTGLSDPRNRGLIDTVEGIIKELRRDGQVPAGLEMALTGATVFWRDVRRSAETSAHTIERWTIAAVLVVLLLLYRAPLLVAALLATVFAALQVIFPLLDLLSRADLVSLYRDQRILITVLVYGAGVNYCLFLSARYLEELDGGAEPDGALGTAIGKVGGTMGASAAAAMIGLGVLSLSRLVRIHESGVALPLSFLVILAAGLTLYPALLRLGGHWTFWPQRGLKAWNVPAEGRFTPLLRWHLFPNVWDRLGARLRRRPALWMLASLAVLVPFAVFAGTRQEQVSFNPLNELPASAPSVVGLRALQQHFPPGLAGPVVVFVSDRKIRFDAPEGEKALKELAQRLESHKAALGVADVRSIVRPLGSYPAVQKLLAERPVLRMLIPRRARPTYISRTGEDAEHVARFDLELADDPLSEAATARVDGIERFLRAELPEQLHGSRVDFFGPTVMLRDLRDLIHRDQQRTHLLVPACILAVLLVVFRKPGLALYLVLTLLLTYFAALGVTRIVFLLLEGPRFAGLDWKVPLILFTVLLALGVDYNIYLVKRVAEEEEPSDCGLRIADCGLDIKSAIRNPQSAIEVAVTRALSRTGRVISGCGFILAATLATLMTGSLGSLRQLGFALGCGILLDTFFVRPVLVPVYLILVRRRLPAPQ